MIFNRFSVNVIIQVILLALSTLFVIWSFYQDYLIVAKFTFVVVWIIQVIILIYYVNRTNRTLKRFLESVKYMDTIKDFLIGASGGIVMFDITNLKSFENIKWWNEVINQPLDKENKRLPLILVGGKSDHSEKREVSSTDAKELSLIHPQIKSYVECSSKTHENVNLIFEMLIRELL